MLQVEGLSVSFISKTKEIMGVRDVSFFLKKGEKTALLGESGCGKSLTAMALFRLLPQNALTTGKAIFANGPDLLALSEKKLQTLRGKDLVLIPQGAISYLNPVFTVQFQIKEALEKLGICNKNHIRQLLEIVELDPDCVGKMYPHELSGGMAQRVMLAIGMASDPSLVVADEPTRGLDEDLKTAYVLLLKNIYQEAAVLLITHDFEVASFCDNIMIMYGGEIIEAGPAQKLIQSPTHPYTQALIASLPKNGMKPLKGALPGLSESFAGCSFYPRCHRATKQCAQEKPLLLKKGDVLGRCHFAS